MAIVTEMTAGGAWAMVTGMTAAGTREKAMGRRWVGDGVAGERFEVGDIEDLRKVRKITAVDEIAIIGIPSVQAKSDRSSVRASAVWTTR